MGCDSLAAVVVMSAAVGVTGAGFCGLFCSHQDISPHFSGTIYGITNSIANVTGFVAPAVVGLITYENVSVCVCVCVCVCMYVCMYVCLSI